MDRIKIPRDWSKTRDNFFSHLFHFTSSKAWVFLSLIFAIGTMSLLGIKGQEALNYGWLFGALIILFIGLPLFFRFKYFRDIPDGWTREQFKAWQKIECKTQKIVDSFSRKYWLIVLCVASIFAGFGIALNEIGLLAFVPGILIISFFVYVFREAYQTRGKMNDSQVENNMALSDAITDAKYGKHAGSKGLLTALSFIFVPFGAIGGTYLISILHEIQLIIIAVGIVSFVVAVAIWYLASKKELNVNEKTLEKLRKKFGVK